MELDWGRLPEFDSHGQSMFFGIYYIWTEFDYKFCITILDFEFSIIFTPKG